MHRFVTAMIYLAILTLLLLWMGDMVGKRERPTVPQIVCPAMYEGETFVHPYSNDKLIDVHQFQIYRTVAGFRMRIPYGVGGLSAPRSDCAMTSGQLWYRWVDGKLLPRYDLKTGKKELRGSEVEFFFSVLRGGLPTPPKRSQAGKNGRELSFPGYEDLVFLKPLTKKDKEGLGNDEDSMLQYEHVIFLNLFHPDGSIIAFHCRPPLLHEINGKFEMVQDRHLKPNSACISGLRIANAIAGRFDVYDDDFLHQGTKITKAVIDEINGYIIKD